MEPSDVARLYRRIEPLHSMIYFAPEVGEELSELGIDHPRAQYFAQRSAAMGPVGPGVVAATYFNFNPALVVRFVPMIWLSASPEAVLNARLRAADRALRRLLGDAATSRECERAGVLARRAASVCGPEGRPLYAAHADLPWPDEPHLALWHAVTLLREYRGDAHLAALLAAGVSGVEALVLHTATGRGFLPEVAQATRGWSAEQWGDAVVGLRSRGLVDDALSLTDDGAAFRDAIEAATDRMSAAPWQHLGDEAAAELAEVGGGLTKRLLEAGAFPSGVFAAGADRAPTVS
ncbi:SCO6745 family protein [Actinomycetospora chiangmaiensis]|uniref:SCO6745 family protein n=1 Tax=Actinomycetospora chiangmaiensis TaxID=402650 RepID=UPI00035CCEF6